MDALKRLHDRALKKVRNGVATPFLTFHGLSLSGRFVKHGILNGHFPSHSLLDDVFPCMTQVRDTVMGMEATSIQWKRMIPEYMI